MEHHPTFPPSSFPAFALCGKFKPSNKPSSDADLGTKLHNYIESLILGDGEHKEMNLTDDQIESCHWAAEQVYEILPNEKERNVEDSLELYDNDGNLITNGHSDFTGYNQDNGMHCIVDLKSGLDFDTENKYYMPQLAVYALAYMQRRSLSYVICHEVYIMPQRHVSYEMSYEKAATIVQAVIEKKNDKEQKPLLNQFCKYCDKLYYCYAVIDRLEMTQSCGGWLKETVKDFNNLQDPEQLSRLVTFAKVAKKWCEDVLTRGKSVLQNNGKINYYQLSARAGAKNITDIQKAFEVSGLSNQEFMGCCETSLTKLGDAIHKHSPGRTKKDVKKEFEGVLIAEGILDIGKPSYSLKQVKEK